jgi:hypothetical protein
MWVLGGHGPVKKTTLAEWGSEAVASLLDPTETLTALVFAQEARHPLLQDHQASKVVNAVSPKLAYIALTSKRLLVLKGSVTDMHPAGVVLEAPVREVRVGARRHGWLFDRLMLDFAGEAVWLKVRRDWWPELVSALRPWSGGAQ